MIIRPMRPRFDVKTVYAPEDVSRRLRTALDGSEGPVIGVFAGRHLELMLDDSVRHYWSPRLALEVEATDRGSVIHTLLGPHPSVWTLFAFVYITMVFSALGCFVFGVSQWLARESAWGLWGLPMIAVVVALMYAVSQTGQRLARDQIHQLQDFLLGALA